ncbi:hypothetical protein [Calothrix rhizosoleniae]|uniref:hypothetical protein n=1 Tax=Calothrix rhizosoleniae TaxID=888997 RepID=UPI000B4976DA|nr:hypothetical protein [Calothrix rhizosoleniae]
MLPRITNSVAWQQAEMLMQPAFIRLIDNIRKLLDVSAWKGTYKDVLMWPEGVDSETQAFVTQLLQSLESATPEKAEQIREHLGTLPMPHPGYHLCLQRQEQQVIVDLWDLCYRVCFCDYYPGDEQVDIDMDLIDENGEVDWLRLDLKAKALVEKLFANLPTEK